MRNPVSLAVRGPGEPIGDPAHLDDVVEPPATLVVVEGVLGDLLGAGVLVECAVDGRWRTDLVHQPDREEGRSVGPPTEDGDVEVRQRLEDSIGVVAVRLQVAGDLGVGIFVGDRDRAAEVGQERDVGHHARDVRHQTRDGDGDPATLAAAGHGDPCRVHGRVRAGRLDGTDGVGEDPAVVVGRRVEDAAGHVPG